MVIKMNVFVELGICLQYYQEFSGDNIFSIPREVKEEMNCVLILQLFKHKTSDFSDPAFVKHGCAEFKPW